jgi:hypothetical protein
LVNSVIFVTESQSIDTVDGVISDITSCVNNSRFNIFFVYAGGKETARQPQADEEKNQRISDGNLKKNVI